MDRPVHLSLERLSFAVRGLSILNEVSFEVRKGDLFSLIGPNGAGKTSALNCISGIYHSVSGRVLLSGRDLTKAKPYEVAAAGIARTFQHAELFGHMTVLDNLLVGRHLKIQGGVVSNGVFWGKTMREEIEHRDVVEEIIDFLELGKHRKKRAGDLPYGIQKIVGLGRALATDPQILLLDEPSAGMNRQEKEDLARFLLRIKHEMGMTMVWVEHDMQLVGDLADHLAVLNFGTKIAEGKPDDVLNDPMVVQSYLGTKAASH
jgi:branched-chain amino acid transport system ATP-binding protein